MISVRSEVQILPGPPPALPQEASRRQVFAQQTLKAGRTTEAGGPTTEIRPLSSVVCHLARGCSSAGRAPALQAGGRRFEPVHLHQCCGARLVGDRRNAVSPKASTTDESEAFIARQRRPIAPAGVCFTNAESPGIRRTERTRQEAEFVPGKSPGRGC